MLWGINSEIIVGMALILLGILFFYAASTGGQTGLYWKALIGYGVNYFLFALGAAFIAHGFWTRANEKKVLHTSHH